MRIFAVKDTRTAGNWLKKAAAIYGRIAEKYKTMSELFPFSGANGTGCTADRNNAQSILKLAIECTELESQAMSIIATCLK